MVAVAMMSACTKIDPTAHECQVATWPHFCKAAITYTFDDGLENQFTTAVPLLDNYDIKATFFPILKDFENWDALAQISGNGHEIGSHTFNHISLSAASADEADNEFATSVETIEKYTDGEKCITMAYPYCVTCDTTITMRHFIGARVCDRRIEPPTPESYYHISSFCIGTESDFKSAQSVIDLFDETRRKSGWCVLLIHEIDNGTGYSPYSSVALDSTLAYVANNKEDFCTETFANLVKYSKERDNVEIELVNQKDDFVSIQVGTSLDKTIYNMPITICRPMPEGWNSARVDGANTYEITDDGMIVADIIPDGRTMDIYRED